MKARLPVLKRSGLAAIGLLLVLAPTSNAQSPISLDARVGVVFPVGDLAKATNTGYDYGISVAYRLSTRWQLRADLDGVHLPGVDNGTGSIRPDINQGYFLFGPELSVVEGPGPWDLLVGVAVGLSVVDSKPLPQPGSPPRLDETVFASSGVVETRYRISGSFSVSGRLRLLVAFMGDRLSYLQEVDPSIGHSGPFVSIPLEAGIRYHF